MQAFGTAKKISPHTGSEHKLSGQIKNACGSKYNYNNSPSNYNMTVKRSNGSAGNNSGSPSTGNKYVSRYGASTIDTSNL